MIYIIRQYIISRHRRLPMEISQIINHLYPLSGVIGGLNMQGCNPLYLYPILPPAHHVI